MFLIQQPATESSQPNFSRRICNRRTCVLARKVAAKEKLPEKLAEVQLARTALAHESRMLRKVEGYVHDLHTARLLRENEVIPSVYCDGETVKAEGEFCLPLDRLCWSKLGCGAQHCRVRPRGASTTEVPNVQFVLED